MTRDSRMGELEANKKHVGHTKIWIAVLPDNAPNHSLIETGSTSWCEEIQRIENTILRLEPRGVTRCVIVKLLRVGTFRHFLFLFGCIWHVWYIHNISTNAWFKRKTGEFSHRQSLSPKNVIRQKRLPFSVLSRYESPVSNQSAFFRARWHDHGTEGGDVTTWARSRGEDGFELAALNYFCNSRGRHTLSPSRRDKSLKQALDTGAIISCPTPSSYPARAPNYLHGQANAHR